MKVFIRAIVRILSFGERLIFPFNLAIASLNGFTFIMLYFLNNCENSERITCFNEKIPNF